MMGAVQVIQQPNAALRSQIEALERSLMSGETVELKTEHHHAPGLYIRTLHIPAGIALTGKVHATEHVFLLVRGSMALASEEGGVVKVEAPFQVVSKPGAKRAGFALTDCVCTNVHITDKTDLAELEAELIVPDPALEGAKEKQCLGQQ